MKKTFHNGLTLIELLLSMAALAILMTIAVPCYRSILQYIHVQSAAQQLSRGIELVRMTAVEARSLVTICPLGKNFHCGANWQHGQLVIENATQKVFNVLPALADDVRVVWCSSLGKNSSLEFDPTGFTHGQVGSFFLSAGHSRKRLIVNFSGRVTVASR